MKVLIVGLGSIGQRHARNLRQLFGDAVEILAYRVRGLPQVITDQMRIDESSTVEAAYRIQTFDSLSAALQQQPVAVLVCNPTSEHLSTALAALRQGCHVFVEKPLSHTEEGVDELLSLSDRLGRIVAVGYQLRLHPALLRARERLCSGALGQVISVRAEMGEYLPDAHPYEDHRVSYAARAELGGGVLLCFIHEFDYLCWLFGRPNSVMTIGGRLGDLGIDVEDTALTSLVYNVGDRRIPAQVHHTFLQRPAVRRCVIVGSAATLDVDLATPRLTMTTAEGVVAVEEFAGFTRNELFLEEMRNFFTAIGGGTAPIVTAREAVISLHVALAAKRSLATGQVVELPAA